LLEGEEQLKHLYLGQNQIKKIDHLVSLPNLQTLDLTANKLLEINNFWLPGSSIDKLRTLNLSKN
jgi:Leucine-rich repeat (LRR) protein